MGSLIPASPSLRALDEVNGDPPRAAKSPRPSPRHPRLHTVNTSMPQNFTITPASARSVSSTAASPYMNSLQSSPDILDGQEFSSQTHSPMPLDLPESALANDYAVKNTTSRDSPAATKAPGLMRKLSQSARTGVQSTGQKLRRKASSSTHDRRDHSTGPITRRRSDSKTNGSNGTSTTDLPSTDFDEFTSADSLGIFGNTDASSITSEPFSPASSNPEGAAPTLPDQLIRGCELIKVTKKRRKKLNFYVSVDGARVFWNPTKTSKQFYVDDIRDIRTGNDTRHYREELNASQYESERWFTILYTDQFRSKQEKTMHLIAESKEDVALWIDTLEALSKHRIDLMTGLTSSLEREHVIRAHWDRETARCSSGNLAKDSEESLDLQAIQALSKSLHIHCSKEVLHKQFRRADARHCGKLNYQEFKDFVRRLKERDDLKAIFSSLTQGSGPVLSKDQFLSFLQNMQGIDANLDPAKWSAEFNHWVRSASSRQGTQSGQSSPGLDSMNFEAFSSFMVSDSCSIYPRQKPNAHFNRPLSEYFISTSHNTYLRGRQVAGDSSTEAYISALRRGCRCVEIDCWNGSEGRPIVTHGHTGTTHVLFSDCISVISRYAFDVSPYPLILSLEVHCDADQQAKMVQIMKDGFGEKLLLKPINEFATKLPSPEELKYRILVKVKSSVPPSDMALVPDKTDVGRRRSQSSPYSIPISLTESPSILSLPSLAMAPSSSPPNSSSGPVWTPNHRSMTATSASSAGEESDTLQTRSNVGSVRKGKKPTSKVTKPLADLGVYLQGYKYRSLVAPECTEFNHIFSLDETKAGRLCRDTVSKAHFEEHNMCHMFRVYPKGLRLDSSNFDPNTFWRRGVQMVALNWQTYDPCMQMNQAMFAAGNDRYGYVLKPDYLRHPQSRTFMPGDIVNRHKLPKHLVKFTVEMISAQQLPRLRSMASDSTINPFVEIQMFIAEDRARGIASGSGGTDSSSRNGYSGIGSPYGRRTKVIMDNGYNPIFSDCFELSLETRHPDLVFVRWIVWHSPSGKTNASNCRQLAVFTAKLSSLQQGYRHLPLYNGNGEEFIFSSLFCRIKKQKSIVLPAELVGSGRSERAGIMKTVTALRRTLSSDRETQKSPDTEEQKKRVMKELVEKTTRA
jgi:phosphatidylinositol phospholipase C, delta